MSDISQASLFSAALLGETESGAAFSDCKLYRYSLWRTWDQEKPKLLFVMLNPSTADEKTNDPTIERCQRRAIQWGFGGLYVGNIFGLRSTDPQALYSAEYPVSDPRYPEDRPGMANDVAISAMVELSGLVICGWGEHGRLHNRGSHVLARIRNSHKNPHALRMTKSGQPGHPLYIPYSAQPFEVPHA